MPREQHLDPDATADRWRDCPVAVGSGGAATETRPRAVEHDVMPMQGDAIGDRGGARQSPISRPCNAWEVFGTRPSAARLVSSPSTARRHDVVSV